MSLPPRALITSRPGVPRSVSAPPVPTIVAVRTEQVGPPPPPPPPAATTVVVWVALSFAGFGSVSAPPSATVAVLLI